VQSKTLSATERKLLESLFEEMVYAKVFYASEGYEASIERNGEREWDDQGRLRAILDISPVKKDGQPWPNLIDGGAFPIYLSADIDEDQFILGVQVSWDMPENAWGPAQSNIWPHKPYLKNPADDPFNLTERYEIRMEPTLKAWMLEHGGAALIRSLLRAERARQLTGE
jgi:hypothetical protein